MDATQLPDWIYNDLAHARAKSSATGRPLLLYWTADWCPPCQEMRVTVLRTPEFAQVAREWVLAEISGDAPDAQVWGERLLLKTYPTMLVLSPAGDEIVRLPGGLTAARFCEVMEVARVARRGVAALADAILHGNAAPPMGAEVTLLAYHSWRQDTHSVAADERLRFFRELVSLVPVEPSDERARVVAHRVVKESAVVAAQSVAKGTSGANRATPTHPAKRPIAASLAKPAGSTSVADGVDGISSESNAYAELGRQFLEVLSGPGATYANLYYLNVDPRPAITLLTERCGIDRGFLLAAWSVAIEKNLAEEPLSGTERLIAHAALVTLSKARGESSEVAPELVQRCARLARELDRTTTDIKERQSVMNMAGHLLKFVGMPLESQQVFERELTKSADPYYFMPYLADLARERGEVVAAMGWMQRARDEAPGAATRFALSGRYIGSLIAATPLDVERVVAASRQALMELRGMPAVAHGVFRRTLQTLAGDLAGWAAGGKAERAAGVESIGVVLSELAESQTDRESREELRLAAGRLGSPGGRGI